MIDRRFETAFIEFPTLTTDRLRLRKVETKDAQDLFALKSDLEVTRHYGQEPHVSIDDTLAWIERLQADYPLRQSLFWVVTFKSEDRAIGACVFWNFESGFHCAELGYELNPAYQRQGIMLEALQAVLSYGFVQLGLHRVEANPLARNEPSRSLLFKLGFTFEGNLRQRVFFRGRFEDQYYFGLLKEEWLKIRDQR